MKFDIAKYVAACGVYQMVKAEHKRPAGLLKPLEIPEWKWKHITIDFVIGLPRTPRGKDAIWVVVDRLTKSAHFIPMKTTNSAKVYWTFCDCSSSWQSGLSLAVARVHERSSQCLPCIYVEKVFAGSRA
jgi:hypothetical protein